jgi:hypothetical protein
MEGHMTPRHIARTAINGAAIALWCVAAAVALVLFGCGGELEPVEEPASCEQRSLAVVGGTYTPTLGRCVEVTYHACGDIPPDCHSVAGTLPADLWWLGRGTVTSRELPCEEACP